PEDFNKLRRLCRGSSRKLFITYPFELLRQTTTSGSQESGTMGVSWQARSLSLGPLPNHLCFLEGVADGAVCHLSGECLSQAILKSMIALEASSFPSVFKEGWLRLNKKVPFLSGADGVVSKFQQKLRCATRIFIRRLRDLLLTTPSAPLRNEIFLLM